MEKFAFEPKSCWDIFSRPGDRKAAAALADRYIDFMSRCKTERETVDYARERLKAAGFAEGGKAGNMFRAMRGKTLFAMSKGRSLKAGLRLVGAHADTPRLDFKQRPLQEQACLGQAKTHYYGGIRKHQWLARPLAIHGVVVLENGKTVPVVIGEAPSDPVFTIADLLPHLASSQADMPLAKAFEGEKLNLLLGHKPLDAPKSSSGSRAGSGAGQEAPKEKVKAQMLALLHAKYGIREEDLYSAELQAVPAGPARYVGLDSAIIGAYGHDDRACVFSALEAFIAAKSSGLYGCLMLWDKEEIGSEGSTSAKSRFFEYCVRDYIKAQEPGLEFSEVMLATRAISADVHAPVDPDWQELHEKLNAALMGYGPCFCKFTGHRGKYAANDAHPEYVAWLRSMLNKAGIPWQMAELGKVDGGGGGTVAMHLAAYGMNIIDCGPPVLSMHSPFELLSVMDLYATRLAYTEFYTAK